MPGTWGQPAGGQVQGGNQLEARYRGVTSWRPCRYRGVTCWRPCRYRGGNQLEARYREG